MREKLISLISGFVLQSLLLKREWGTGGVKSGTRTKQIVKAVDSVILTH